MAKYLNKFQRANQTDIKYESGELTGSVLNSDYGDQICMECPSDSGTDFHVKGVKYWRWVCDHVDDIVAIMAEYDEHSVEREAAIKAKIRETEKAKLKEQLAKLEEADKVRA